MSTRAYNLEQALKSRGIFNGVAGLLEGGAYARLSQLLATVPQVQTYCGQVLDAVAGSYCYRVALDNNGGIQTCLHLLQTSALAFGAKQLNTIPPGSRVWVHLHPQLTYGVIFGVEPPPTTSPALCRNDRIHQSSCCGIRVDQAHFKLYDTAGGIIDASANRPSDILTVGEAGWQSETGIRLYLDSFMAQLAVDEACGIFAYYHDQLLRVCGVNLDEFSSQHRRQLYDDAGELFHVTGHVIYPWEQYGAFFPGMETLRSLSPVATQTTTPHYASMEPVFDDQQPFYRCRQFGGYLGQGSRREVNLPPTTRLLNRLSSDSKPVGVFSEQIGLHGGCAWRSARGFTIAKRPAIPVAVQKKIPEDPTGDRAATYKASGQFGEGREHEIVGQFQSSDSSRPSLQTAAGVLDYMAHLFAWDGTHPFHYHEADWNIPSEQDTTIETNQASIDFERLQTKFYLNPPDPIQLVVDHRYGRTDYYPNSSFLTLLPDGGIIIGDGFGSSITMTGGHIFLDGPGDIWVKAGRNTNVFSGQDTVLRARNSMDLSTTESDIRLRSWKNLHMLGGASKQTGGVLIESPTSTNFDFDKPGEAALTGGITLKAAQGMLYGLAKDIYLRTGGGDVAGKGKLILDAERGDGELLIQADTLAKYITTSETVYIGKAGRVRKATQLSTVGMKLDGKLDVKGAVAADGDLLVDGSVTVLTGTLGTEKEPKQAVVKISPAASNKKREQLKKLDESLAAEKKTGTATYEEIKTELYEDKKPGNDDLISNLHFTFRTTEQYGTADAVLYESYWQQQARENGGAGKPWVERPSNSTWPYPGEAAHTANGFCTQPLDLYDVPSGISKDPTVAEGYKSPSYHAPETSGLNSSYLVIGRV